MLLHPRATDLTGRKFGRLTATSWTGRRDRGALVWNFACDCGVSVERVGVEVVRGKVLSCGCYKTEINIRSLEQFARPARIKSGTTHGMSQTRTFYIWSGMIQRCTNSKASGFEHYGGRGIKVCNRWLNSFEAFLADMGVQPVGLQIDRIDNDGDYEPGNCRWVTCQVNMQNRRVSRAITHDGRTLNIKQWAAEIGLSHQAIAYRLRSGWSVSDALTITADHGNGWKNGNR